VDRRFDVRKQIPIVEAALMFLAIAAISAANQAKTITASEARTHIGSDATVCGKVVSPRYAPTTRGQPTFLNFNKPHPDQESTVVIRGADRAKFGSPEVAYQDMTICVSGTIQEYQGRAEIIATDPRQITLLK
jgi:hypothetical protein